MIAEVKERRDLGCLCSASESLVRLRGQGETGDGSRDEEEGLFGSQGQSKVRDGSRRLQAARSTQRILSEDQRVRTKDRAGSREQGKTRDGRGEGEGLFGSRGQRKAPSGSARGGPWRLAGTKEGGGKVGGYGGSLAGQEVSERLGADRGGSWFFANKFFKLSG